MSPRNFGNSKTYFVFLLLFSIIWKNHIKNKKKHIPINLNSYLAPINNNNNFDLNEIFVFSLTYYDSIREKKRWMKNLKNCYYLNINERIIHTNIIPCLEFQENGKKFQISN